MTEMTRDRSQSLTIISPKFAWPWRERSGAFSRFKAVVFAGLFWPAAMAAWALAFGPPVARPVMETLHLAGRWAVYFLLISLAVTPLMEIFGWRRLLLARRMLGVAAFAYVALHVALYVLDQRFDLAKVAGEIAMRLYLAIGFAGFAILGALAATSTDAMIRRLGAARWRALHRLAYGAIVIGVVHYMLQTKSDLWQPVLAAGIALWLIGWRVLRWRKPLALAAHAFGVATVVALGETAYLTAKFGAPVAAAVEAQFDILDMGPRPAAWLLLGGFAVSLAAWGRGKLAAQRAP